MDSINVYREMLPYINHDSRPEWVGYIEGMKSEYPMELPEDKDPYHPCSFIRKVGRMLDEDYNSALFDRVHEVIMKEST